MKVSSAFGVEFIQCSPAFHSSQISAESLKKKMGWGREKCHKLSIAAAGPGKGLSARHCSRQRLYPRCLAKEGTALVPSRWRGSCRRMLSCIQTPLMPPRRFAPYRPHLPLRFLRRGQQQQRGQEEERGGEGAGHRAPHDGDQPHPAALRPRGCYHGADARSTERVAVWQAGGLVHVRDTLVQSMGLVSCSPPLLCRVPSPLEQEKWWGRARADVLPGKAPG